MKWPLRIPFHKNRSTITWTCLQRTIVGTFAPHFIDKCPFFLCEMFLGCGEEMSRGQFINNMYGPVSVLNGQFICNCMMWCLSSSKEEYAHFEQDLTRSRHLHQGVCCVFYACQWVLCGTWMLWELHMCRHVMYVNRFLFKYVYRCFMYIYDYVHVCMNAWMKRCECGCFCTIFIFMWILKDYSVVNLVWLCMTAWIILHNEWISCIHKCEWTITVLFVNDCALLILLLSYCDYVMYDSGWLAGWQIVCLYYLVFLRV